MSSDMAALVRRGREEAEEAKEAKLLGELPPSVERARPLKPEEWPKTAKSLVKLAEAEGWETHTTFADGWMVGGTPKRHLHVQSVLVTARRQIEDVTVASLAACWMKRLDKAEPAWSFDFAWSARRGGDVTKLNSSEARAFLKGGDS